MAGAAGLHRGPRAEIGAVVAVLVVGGALGLVVAQAAWVHVRTAVPHSAFAGGGVPLDLEISGTQVAPAVAPLAVLAVAGALGLLATRGWVRRVLGVLLMLAGAGVAVAALHVLTAPREAAAGALAGQSVDASAAAEATYTVAWWWPALAALAGCLVVAGGVVTGWRSGAWPAMGSRFDAPTAAASGPRTDPWSALDRGEDPTAVDDPAAVDGGVDLPESPATEPGTTDGGGRLR
jgi:uncharacterized membrane protein (TIGR02234 family)